MAHMETPRGRGAAVSGSNLAGKRDPENSTPLDNSQALLNDPWIVDLTAQIRSEHEAVVGSFRSGFAHAVKCGELLLEAKDVAGHGNWLPWLRANPWISERAASNYMRLATNRAEIDAKSACSADLTISAALKLLSPPPAAEAPTAPTPAPRSAAEDKDTLLLRLQDENAVEKAPADKFETLHYMRLAASSASPEWYTPKHVVDLAAQVLGQIDLDPCWHPDSPVNATATFIEQQDGLAQEWAGRVYLNPPYGRAIDGWVERLVTEYESGRVQEAVALVPARVDTEWFRRLDDYPRCFISGRLTFSNADNPAPFPSAVVYLGNDVAKFHRIFGAIGSIFVKLEADRLTAAEMTADSVASYDAALAAMRGES
jgi:hypothetical protein